MFGICFNLIEIEGEALLKKVIKAKYENLRGLAFEGGSRNICSRRVETY